MFCLLLLLTVLCQESFRACPGKRFPKFLSFLHCALEAKIKCLPEQFVLLIYPWLLKASNDTIAYEMVHVHVHVQLKGTRFSS